MLLGIAGVVAAGGIALAANAISGDSIGLSAEPVSLASNAPAPKPAPAARRRARGRPRSGLRRRDGHYELRCGELKRGTGVRIIRRWRLRLFRTRLR